MVMMLEPDDDDGGVGRIRTRENAFFPYMKMRERTLIPFFLAMQIYKWPLFAHGANGSLRWVRGRGWKINEQIYKSAASRDVFRAHLEEGVKKQCRLFMIFAKWLFHMLMLSMLQSDFMCACPGVKEVKRFNIKYILKVDFLHWNKKHKWNEKLLLIGEEHNWNLKSKQNSGKLSIFTFA